MNTFLRKTLPVANVHLGLLILRVVAAGFMLTHGIPKLNLLFTGNPDSFAGILGMNAALSLLLAVFAEFFCAVLVLLGLFTRLATIPLVITMAVAAFHVHNADPFSVKEMALLFMLIFFFLLLTGAGNYSFDALLYRRSGKRQRRYI